MNNKPIEKRIKTAFDNAVPDVLDYVLSDCIAQNERILIMTERKKTAPWIKRTLIAAASLIVIMAAAVMFVMYDINYTVASTVSLDVNPSVEIKVNKKEKVLEVNALNADGVIIIDEMDFSGNDIDVVVNALIGSMFRNGYINEIANSILLSVDNSDEEKGEQLCKKLTEEINGLLQTNTFTGAVLSQTVKTDSELEALAAEYGITTGKAQLIQSIIAQNTTYEFSALVSLSINELNLLISSAGSVLENINSIGSASDKAYIGYEKAIDIALADMGTKASTIVEKRAKLHADDGIMVYEIELFSDSYEYEYEINALTGAIIEKDLEKIDPDDIKDDVSSSEEPIISAAEAKDIAFAHAGADANSISGFKIEYDSGVYEIEFFFNNREYDYEVDSCDGSIVDYEIEYDTSDDDIDIDDDDDDDVSISGAAPVISKTRAKNAALAHAGADANSISGYKIEYDSGVYEIEFFFNNREYDYEINSYDGSIIDYEIEYDTLGDDIDDDDDNDNDDDDDDDDDVCCYIISKTGNT